jgi:hypothetical protein
MSILLDNNRPDFDAWYESQNKSLLHSTRESHWETWQEAQRRAMASVALDRMVQNAEELGLYQEAAK